MTKRTRWTYEAELDYVHEVEKGKWVVGFLDEKGNPYECPTTTDVELVKRLEELDKLGLANRLRVTVEINKELDRKNRQFPTLVNVKPIRVRKSSFRNVGGSVRLGQELPL